MNDRRALVTGAGGFIGSHLTEALVRDGWHVRAFLRYTSRASRGWLNTAPQDVQREIDWVFGDVRDFDAVRRASLGCRRIYHLAALIGIPYSYDSPRAYVETNVVGTLNVLNAAVELGDALETVVHTSTSECYGTARVVPIDENHPLQAQSPYAATKIAADKLAESYHRSFGLRVATLRPFNTYGPRQSLRAIIPTIAAQCLTANVVRVGNLEPTRDFTFVEDMVRAFLMIAECRAAHGRVVNVGTGRERSVREVFEETCRIVGRQPRIEVQSDRVRPSDSEVGRLVADAGLARELFGWEPRWTFADGLRATIEWLETRRAELRPEVYHV